MSKISSTVSFHVDASDTDLCTAILALLGGNPGTTTAPATSSSSKKKTTIKKKDDEGDKAVTMAEVKKAMMAAKKEHGEDFVIDVLEDVGGTTNPEATIARQLAACDEGNYAAMLVAFAEGPTEEEEEEEEEEDDELEAEAVIKACRAYSKANSRADLKKLLKGIGDGVKVADISDCTQKELQAIMKAVV